MAESKVHELQASAKSLVTILDLESYGIDFNQVEDAGIFFYVAGYAARSLSKILSCSHCTSTQREEGLVCNIGCESTEGLESGDRENAFDGGYWPIKQSFLDQVNRGGLWKPSDLCFITCIHIWLFYEEILKYQTAKTFLFHTEDVQGVFITALQLVMERSEDTADLINQKCRGGHTYGFLLPQLARKLFNIFMKNFCSEAASEHHKGKKRKGKNASSDHRKIVKLQSCST